MRNLSSTQIVQRIQSRIGAMEGKMMTILAFLLLSCLCHTGSAEYCKLSDLAVTQADAPQAVGNGYTEYKVTVENRCICTQQNVKLSCPGFSAAMGVDPDVLSVDGDGKLCTLNGGRPIAMGPENAVKFSYSWRFQLSFAPVSSTISCS